MTTSDTIISLTPSQLHDCEETLVQHGELSASTFRFASGVCGLRLGNERGELVLLPFQGQQIWSALFDGRELTMSSMFDEPHPTRDFLATFGGFLLHCGVTTLGGPSPRGIDPLHGELPNAPYQLAHIIVGEDDRGPYIALGGQYRHTIAFSCNYAAEPLEKLYAGCALFHADQDSDGFGTDAARHRLDQTKYGDVGDCNDKPDSDVSTTQGSSEHQQSQSQGCPDVAVAKVGSRHKYALKLVQFSTLPDFMDHPAIPMKHRIDP